MANRPEPGPPVVPSGGSTGGSTALPAQPERAPRVASGGPTPSGSGADSPGLLAPVKGFGVTFATMFKKVNTEQYPEEKKPTAPRYHGRHVLNRYSDGLEKCIGCELCAWSCPADAIYVEGADNTELERFSPGERYGRVYQINYLRCIFCGLCIEACPTRALTMSNEYELADRSRRDLIFEKKDLLAPLLPGMLAAPHPMAPGAGEEDYYAGRVGAATPEQVQWVQRHRGDGTPDGAQGGTEDGAEDGTAPQSPQALVSGQGRPEDAVRRTLGEGEPAAGVAGSSAGSARGGSR